MHVNSNAVYSFAIQTFRNDMDLVNFQVGAKTVALPILNILLTERYSNDLTDVPNENPSFIGIKDFMNVPIPIFDLGKILNNCSTKQLNKDLVDKFVQLRKGIFDWFHVLQDSVDSNRQSTTSIEQSEFIKWLSEFTSDNEDLLDLLNKVPALMTQTYDCFLSTKANDADKAVWQRVFETSQNQVTRLFDSVIEQVEVGYKPIIVFTTTDGRSPHVGLLVDKVEDSINVDETDIKSLDTVTTVGFELDNRTKSLMKGLIQIENKHSIIIDPSVLFQE